MRIACIADLHLGNHKAHGGDVQLGMNQRCRDTLDALSFGCYRAIEQGADLLVVAGDFLDDERPRPQLLRAARDILVNEFAVHARPAQPYLDAPVHVLRGNHESVSGEPGDHSLGPLELPGSVAVYEHATAVRISKDQCVLHLPFRAEKGDVWVPTVLASLTKALKVLKPVAAYCHLGIYTAQDKKDLPWDLAASKDVCSVDVMFKALRDCNVPAAFAGNWHAPAVWQEGGRSIVQISALVPTGWDNLGTDYGYVVIFDTATGEITRVRIPGPRFLKVSSHDELVAAVGSAEEDDQLYVRWHGDIAERDQAEASRVLVSGGSTGVAPFACFDFVPDQKTMARTARAAASAASSATTLTSALAEFVQKMPLPEGLPEDARNTIIAEALDYLEVDDAGC